MTMDCRTGSPCPHVPTEATRAVVSNLYAVGVKQDAIAKRLHIDIDTLAKYYRVELDEGLQDMNITAMNVVFAKVKEGSLKAAIAWLKMRAGWCEARPTEDPDRDKVLMYLLDMVHRGKNTAQEQQSDTRLTKV